MQAGPFRLLADPGEDESPKREIKKRGEKVPRYTSISGEKSDRRLVRKVILLR